MDSQYTEFILKKELAEIFENAEEGHFTYKTEIKIQAGEEWLIPVRIDYLYLLRDYAGGNLGDFRVVEVLMGLGDLTHLLLPFKDDLRVEVTNTPLNKTGNAINLDRPIVVKTYRGIVNTSKLVDYKVGSKMGSDPTITNLNHGTIVPVQLQLVDESVYKLLTLSCGTVFRESTTMNALLTTYSNYIKALGNRESERIEQLVVRDGYNDTVRKQINIPDGTMVKDLHQHLQNREGGIYNNGIGRFVQNNKLYVYPLYDLKAYEKNTKILNIINITSNKYEGAEITFKDDPKYITILATGNVKVYDESLVNKLDSGNAYRFGDADKLLANTFDQDNKVLVDRATNTYEVGVETLETGVNNIRVSNDRLTSNPYKAYSDLAKKQGRQIDVEWVKGHAELLLPGMPVKYVTADGESIDTYYGVLLGVNENRIPTNPGIITNNFNGIVTLSIFVNRKPINQ